MRFTLLAVFLTFSTSVFAAEVNLCLNEKGPENRLTMAKIAGIGLYNANNFGSSEEPSLWDAKEVKMKSGIYAVTVELRSISEPPKSSFYKSIIDAKKCQVTQTSDVNSL